MNNSSDSDAWATYLGTVSVGDRAQRIAAEDAQQPADARIDAALGVPTFIRDYDDDDGWRMRVTVATEHPRIEVVREEEDGPDGSVRVGRWTIIVPDRGQVFTHAGSGEFESPAAARDFAAALTYAAELADRLEEARAPR